MIATETGTEVVIETAVVTENEADRHAAVEAALPSVDVEVGKFLLNF